MNCDHKQNEQNKKKMKFVAEDLTKCSLRQTHATSPLIITVTALHAMQQMAAVQ
jgi:hypothetical protein